MLFALCVNRIYRYLHLVQIAAAFFKEKCRERIIVAQKHINIMRERESLPSHADFLCSLTKPDMRSQKHTALAFDVSVSGGQ